MADDSTDTAFGFILFILFLALLGTRRGALARLRPRLGPQAERPVVTTLEGSSYLHAQAHSNRMKQLRMSTLLSTWTPWMPARSARQRQCLGGDAESHAGIYRRSGPNGI